MTIERLIATAAAGWLVHLAGAPERTDIPDLPAISLIILLVFAAPVIETLLLQTLPCAIGRKFAWSPTALIIACWVPFAAAHLPSGIATFICAGLVSGYYLAYTYVYFRGRSFASAYWATVASHAFLNALVAVAMLASKAE